MAFLLARETTLPGLDGSFQEFVDDQTGARHLHLAMPGPENCFLVAFPTDPGCDDGRAHILEHLSLEGSEGYRARGPFARMATRSVASFMNAMTYPTATAYPFATANGQDFLNLMDVYLDAAFFPRLDYLSFLQEGWRREERDGKMTLQGVVLNEMKGAQEDGHGAAYQAMAAAILQGGPGSFNAGGLPSAIPDLSHEALVAFHRDKCHPSFALFMTCGPIDPAVVQRKIVQRVLQRGWQRREPLAPAPRAILPSAPRSERLTRPSQSARPDERAFCLCWVVGDSRDPEASMAAHAMASLLCLDGSCPVSAAIEEAGFGRASPMNGVTVFETSVVFCLGMENLTAKQVPKAKRLILAALAQVARDGVEPALAQAALRDLEWSARGAGETDGPRGVDLLAQGMVLALAGADPLQAWDFEPLMAWLRARCAEPRFSHSLAARLLDSPARFEFSIEPDAGYFDREAVAEALLLARLPQGESDLLVLAEEARALQAAQRAPLDASSLPKITLADLAAAPVAPAIVRFERGDGFPSLAWVEAAANGICRVELLCDASAMDPEDWPWVDLYAQLFSDLAVGRRSVPKTQLWRRSHAVWAGSGAEPSSSPGSPRDARLMVSRSAEGLARDIDGMCSMLAESILAPDFANGSRLAYLVEGLYEEAIEDVGESGFAFAEHQARSAFGALASMEHRLHGLPSILWLRQARDLSRDPKGLAAMKAKLLAIHLAINASPSVATAFGAEPEAQRAARALAAALPGFAAFESLATATPSLRVDASPPTNMALVASSALNHCHWAATLPGDGVDRVAELRVLASLITHGHLLRAARDEGGAYDAGASCCHAGIFSMQTYRDPRVAGAYADFQNALEWAAQTAHAPEEIESAIFGEIKSFDAQSSPMDRASEALDLALRGVDAPAMARRRLAILACDSDSLRSLARALLAATPSRCAFVGKPFAREATLAGLSPIDIDAIPSMEPALANR